MEYLSRIGRVFVITILLCIMVSSNARADSTAAVRSDPEMKLLAARFLEMAFHIHHIGRYSLQASSVSSFCNGGVHLLFSAHRMDMFERSQCRKRHIDFAELQAGTLKGLPVMIYVFVRPYAWQDRELEGIIKFLMSEDVIGSDGLLLREAGFESPSDDNRRAQIEIVEKLFYLSLVAERPEARHDPP